MTSWPYSRSCRTASIRSGRAGGLAEELDYILPTLPVKYDIKEDADINATYYFFDLKDFLSEKTFTLLLVAAGAMGPPRAAALTAHINSKFRPANFVVLGISGSLDKSLLLGDFFIPKVIENYLSVAAATPAINPGKWQISPSSGPYRPDPRLLDRVRSFRNRYPKAWEDWKQRTTAVAEVLLKEKRAPAIANNMCREEAFLLAEEANLASGEILGKSEAFVEWLKSQDRKYSAMDMESSGVLDVSDLAGRDGPRFIAIRGISDFADERKSQVEAEFRVAFRQIAIKNAAAFLWAAVQSRVFSLEPIDAQAEVPLLSIALEFRQYLASTDIIFQHRYKAAVELSDLFVYPDMEAIRDKGSSSSKVNASTLTDAETVSERTLILGDARSGKTSLAKSLFVAHYKHDALPILLRGDDFKNAHFDRVLQDAFRNQYFSLTLEQSRNLRGTIVVLLDDYECVKLNRRHRQKLLEYLGTVCDKMIVFGGNEMLTMNTRFADFGNFKRFQLLPFGHTRRDELISKWIFLEQEETLEESDYLNKLDVCVQHVNSILMRNIVPPKPFFICSIMQYFEAAVPSDYHLTSHGHCYQSLIVQSFVKAGIGPREIDKYVNYLTELGYFMFASRNKLMSDESFKRFASTYSATYLIESHDDVIRRLINCRVLRHDEYSNLEFGYKYTYYFYCAK